MQIARNLAGFDDGFLRATRSPASTGMWTPGLTPISKRENEDGISRRLETAGCNAAGMAAGADQPSQSRIDRSADQPMKFETPRHGLPDQHGSLGCSHHVGIDQEVGQTLQIAQRLPRNGSAAPSLGLWPDGGLSCGPQSNGNLFASAMNSPKRLRPRMDGLHVYDSSRRVARCSGGFSCRQGNWRRPIMAGVVGLVSDPQRAESRSMAQAGAA